VSHGRMVDRAACCARCEDRLSERTRRFLRRGQEVVPWTAVNHMRALGACSHAQAGV
jgi:hypothetical protein